MRSDASRQAHTQTRACTRQTRWRSQGTYPVQWAAVGGIEIVGQHGPKSGRVAAFEEDSKKFGVGRHDGGFQRRRLGEGGERKGGDEGGGHGDRELFN